MSMSDEVWLSHANPWSVWTRILTYPFLILAFWSRAWIDLYFIIPVALILVWSWINPRVFRKQKLIDNWGSKGVLGEKIFVNHKNKKIPEHHVKAAYITTTITLIGVLILVYGLFVLDIWPTLLEGSIAILGKIWYIDRMVWLYENMK